MTQKGETMLRYAGTDAGLRTRGVAIGSLIARMREWLAPKLQAGDRGIGAVADEVASDACVVARIGAPKGAFEPLHPNASRSSTEREGEVVRFPLDDRRLLARLAQELRSDFAGEDEADSDPVLLTLAAGVPVRLLIDSTSHVDVRGEHPKYRVVLGDALSTRITLETPDFDEVRLFVSQYLLVTRGHSNPAGGPS